MATKTIMVCDRCGKDAIERLKVKGLVIGTNLTIDLCAEDLQDFLKMKPAEVAFYCECGRSFKRPGDRQRHQTRSGHKSPPEEEDSPGGE